MYYTYEKYCMAIAIAVNVSRSAYLAIILPSLVKPSHSIMIGRHWLITSLSLNSEKSILWQVIHQECVHCSRYTFPIKASWIKSRLFRLNDWFQIAASLNAVIVTKGATCGGLVLLWNFRFSSINIYTSIPSLILPCGAPHRWAILHTLCQLFTIHVTYTGSFTAFWGLIKFVQTSVLPA